ncbi:MAG: hypothetical protein ACYC8V_04585 [Caulobacteraceae bacterium]
MPLPAPALGLVVQYGFVWAGPGRGRPPDAGKHRPCLIVDVRAFEEPTAPARVVVRVVYLPISHAPPRQGEPAIAIPPAVARHLGLTWQSSFLYWSYAVRDDWPFDLAPVPGSTDRFDYGFVPPRLFAIVATEFRRHLAARDFAHRR